MRGKWWQELDWNGSRRTEVFFGKELGGGGYCVFVSAP